MFSLSTSSSYNCQRLASFVLFCIFAHIDISFNTVFGWSSTTTAIPRTIQRRNINYIDYSFTNTNHNRIRRQQNNVSDRNIVDTSSSSSYSTSNTKLYSSLLTSLIAGSIAGAVGVGVAYPLDTLKTKQQVHMKNNNIDNANYSIIDLIKDIYKEEGINGFYGGVKATMMGQAILKGVAFTLNAISLQYLQQQQQQYNSIGTITDTECLILAACISGFLTSFLVVPIERVKVIMQAQLSPQQYNQNMKLHSIEQQKQQQQIQHNTVVHYIDNNMSLNSNGSFTASSMMSLSSASSRTVSCQSRTSTSLSATSSSSATTISSIQNSFYNNEFECLKAIIQNDGFHGLMLRGITPTIAREVPRYAIYFVLYSLIMQCSLITVPTGQFAPLIGGALAGCLSWLPVYPTDVVKTMIQNTQGGSNNDVNAFKLGKDLFDDGGLEIFYDGLTPKLLRAAIINAVTFFMYDSVIDILTVSTTNNNIIQ